MISKYYILVNGDPLKTPFGSKQTAINHAKSILNAFSILCPFDYIIEVVKETFEYHHGLNVLVKAVTVWERTSDE